MFISSPVSCHSSLFWPGSLRGEAAVTILYLPFWGGRRGGAGCDTSVHPWVLQEEHAERHKAFAVPSAPCCLCSQSCVTSHLPGHSLNATFPESPTPTWANNVPQPFVPDFIPDLLPLWHLLPSAAIVSLSLFLGRQAPLEVSCSEGCHFASCIPVINQTFVGAAVGPGG